MAPADYERKQTLVNAERFTTPELKEYERKILTAHDRSHRDREANLRRSCGKSVLEAAGRIRRSSAAVAEADLLANFAHLASLRRYVRPVLTDELVLEAVAARHPVIEQMDGGDARRAVHCERSLSEFAARIRAQACC